MQARIEAKRQRLNVKVELTQEIATLESISQYKENKEDNPVIAYKWYELATRLQGLLVEKRENFNTDRTRERSELEQKAAELALTWLKEANQSVSSVSIRGQEVGQMVNISIEPTKQANHKDLDSIIPNALVPPPGDN